jgi:hypothetical protein
VSTETEPVVECLAAWQDDHDKDHGCIEDVGHAGGHECGCGARVPQHLLTEVAWLRDGRKVLMHNLEVVREVLDETATARDEARAEVARMRAELNESLAEQDRLGARTVELRWELEQVRAKLEATRAERDRNIDARLSAEEAANRMQAGWMSQADHVAHDRQVAAAAVRMAADQWRCLAVSGPTG